MSIKFVTELLTRKVGLVLRCVFERTVVVVELLAGGVGVFLCRIFGETIIIPGGIEAVDGATVDDIDNCYAEVCGKVYHWETVPVSSRSISGVITKWRGRFQRQHLGASYSVVSSLQVRLLGKPKIPGVLIYRTVTRIEIGIEKLRISFRGTVCREHVAHPLARSCML
jgi:hypothetical protein